MERRKFVKTTALVALGAVLAHPLDVVAEKTKSYENK